MRRLTAALLVAMAALAIGAGTAAASGPDMTYNAPGPGMTYNMTYN